jgi:arylsulfatase A-like enzyme
MLGASAAPRFARLVERVRARRGPWLATKLIAFAGVALAIIGPPNEVRVVSFETAGSAAHYVLALTVWRLPHPDVPPDPRVDAAWLAAPQGPPRTPDPLSSDAPPPVVVLVTIDATRADVVMDPEHLAHLPTFSRLMREGVTFTEARSPGSQTAVSLTALFAGKYFSGMRWERFGVGKNRFEYAAHDATPRLPTLLGDGGIPTFKVVSLAFLTNEYGVAPGFAEEIKVTTGRRHATATEVTTPLLDRLRKAKGEPLFAFVHLTEPHAPYDRGAVTEGAPFDCYVSEIEVADAYLGRILKTLEAKDLARRAVLIVSSDHGEAFGEHGTWHHTKTIYEELLRVPLIVWGAGVSPRRVDVPVTLLDLGPTILDIFNQPTPSTWAGESLVPFLRGGAASPTRPILAEGRLRKALFVGDTKLLVDTRRKTIEVYDLASDPGEEHNLWDDDPDRYAPLLSALFAYGAAHDYRAPGYDPVYKP